MEGIAGRMKYVRMHFGVSGLALGAELGLGSNSWNAYEQGRSLPGSKVLIALAERDVDINWLLTGVGGPFRSKSLGEPTPRDPLEIAELSLIAERSTVALQMRVLEALVRHGAPCSSATIAAALEEDERAVVAALLELHENGAIQRDRVESYEVYRAEKDVPSQHVAGATDVSALTLESIKFVSNEIRSGLRSALEATLLLNGVAGVADHSDGLHFIQKLKGALEQLGTEHHGNAHKVRFLVAARVEPS